MLERPGTLLPDQLAITFGYDREGNVDRLSAPFEPDALTPAFRAACVGTYRIGSQMHVVALF